MEEVEKRVLNRVRTQLINEMVVTESFLSAFCQSGLLDEHLIAGIRAETNFEKRAAKLLETLPSHSSSTKAFMTLLEILEITNPWLSEKMKAALHDERTKDARTSIPSSVAQCASIKGFAQARVHIDVDIKERSRKFVLANLYHLTEVEQKGVEKWMADELQKERRRQQFRAPHEVRRQPGNCHSTKETQTETSIMELRELFNELAVYLHGVDYDEREDSLSFAVIQDEVKELLARTKKLDNLFLNCWNKFDDTDKYSMSLPDLIDRMVHSYKRLMTADELNKQMIQKLKEERGRFKSWVSSLEDEVTKLQSQSHTPHSQCQDIVNTKNRQHTTQKRNSSTGDADDALTTRADKSNTQHQTLQASESQSNVTDNVTHSSKKSARSNAGIGATGQETTHETTNGEQILYKEPEKNVQVTRNGSKNRTQSDNARRSVTFVENQGQNRHKAETVHYEENQAYGLNSNGTKGFRSPKSAKSHGDTTNNCGINQHRDNSQADTEDENKTSKFHPHQTGMENMQAPKIRRHASEESLRISMKKEDAKSTSTSRLNASDYVSQRLSVEDLPTASVQEYHQQKQRLARVDLQTKMQQMIDSYKQKMDKHRQQQQQSQSTPAAPTAADKTMNAYESTSSNPSGKAVRSATDNPASPSSLNKNSSFQASYQLIHNSRHQDKVLTGVHGDTKAGGRNMNKPQNGHVYRTEIEQNSSNKSVSLVGNNYSTGEKFSERYIQPTYANRTASLERLNNLTMMVSSQTRSGTDFQGRNQAKDFQIRGGYTSDSELILKPAYQRGRTTRKDKSRNHVRFASPVARTTLPSKRAAVMPISQKLNHYQMDTASTARRKIQTTV